MAKDLKNPFPFAGYYGQDYFCDREKETVQIIRNIVNGGSTTLTAIRRMGKTGLIHHCFGSLPKGFTGIYVDILSTENLTEFLNLLTTSILRDVPEKSSPGKKLWTFIKSLRPVISFDTLTGNPKASFEIRHEQVEQNISSVLQFLDQQEFKTVIAIDEFQQILNYPEKNTDAWLRGTIQQLKNVRFLFSGSHQHLMAEIFSSPGRPFFRSTHMIKLDKIDKNEYSDFIIRKFAEYKKVITRDIVSEILEWCDVHTYYVQLLCNRVFSATPKKVTAGVWREQADELLREQEFIFLNYRSLLTQSQWQLLKSIAIEGRVYKPTSRYFLEKHKLGSSAAVLRSLQALIKYEMVFHDFDQNGEKYFSVYDVLFRQWAKMKT